jgi:hypothetical protein
MRHLYSAVAGTLCASLLFATAGFAQVKPAQSSDPGVHRLVIYNGAERTVHYVTNGESLATDPAALRDLERVENEAALAGQLAALRREYVNDEQLLEKRRTNVQLQFYGYASDAGYGYPGYYRGYYGYPYGSAYYGGAYGGFGGSSWNLAAGNGYEGAIKTDMAQTLATQATPEYAARVARQHDAALARLGNASPSIRAAVGISDRGGVRPAAAPPDQDSPEEVRLAAPGAQVVVTRRFDNTTEKIEGTVVRDTGEWLVLQTSAGKRTLAKHQIVDVLEPKK